MADWGFERLTVLGNHELLRQPLVGVVSSRQCPAGLILAAHDWAKTAREQNLALVGGFHTHFGSIVHFDKPKRYYRNAFLLPLVGLNPSPLTAAGGEGFKRKRYHSPVEQEVLRLSTDLKKALEAGRLLLVSPFGVGVRRADSQRAERRNRLVVGLASRVLVIHAAPGSATERLVREIKALGKQMEELEALS